MWNNTINYINLSYLPFCLTFYHSYMSQTSFLDYFTTITLGILLVGSILSISWVLIRNKKYIIGDKIIQKYGQLYKGIQIRRRISHYAFMYWPISWLRRLIFVLIPLVLEDSGMQIQFLILTQTFYIIWYGQVRPHKYREDQLI